MLKQFRYYVVDSVTEKIIASFFASSYDMAVRVLKNFDVSKAKLTWEDVLVFRDPNGICEYESFSEICSLKKGQIESFKLDDVVTGDLFEENDNAE